MNRSQATEGVVALEAPDYVALVIEWNDDNAWDDDQTTLVSESNRTRGTDHTIATLVGALGAFAFATWGLYRLRASS
jgi:hypothetical protein